MSADLMKLPPALNEACKEGNYEAAIAQLDSFMAEHPALSRQHALVQIALHALNHHHPHFHRTCLDKGGLIIDPAEKKINQAFAFAAVACDDLDMVQLYLDEGELPLDIGGPFTGDMLNTAAMENAVTVATWLLDEKGFDVNSQKAMYNAPKNVVVAASWPDDCEDTSFLKLLLDRGAKFQGEGAICEAAKVGHAQAVHLLLEAGADLEEVITHGMTDERIDLGTPLWMAAGHGEDATVDYLIQRGANLHYRDPRYNLTPLLIARVRSHEECADLIELALMKDAKER